MIFRRTCTVALILGFVLASEPIPTHAKADAESTPVTYGPEDGLIRLNDRWFDAHAPVDPAWEQYEFFPVQRVPWIRAVLDAEPLLNTMVIHIEAQPQASANIFGFIYNEKRGYMPFLSPPDWLRPPEGFNITRNTRAGPATFVVRQERPTPTFTFLGLCRIRSERGPLSTCRIHAEYPDPRLYVMARVYGPPDRMDAFATTLPAVAARLREIAFCLDVTDEVLAGTWRPSPPPEGATLTGCAELVS